MAAPDFAAPNICTEAVAPARPKEQSVSRGYPRHTISHIEAILDFAVGAAAVLSTYLLLFLGGAHFDDQHAWRQITAGALTVGLILTFLQYRERALRHDGGLLRVQETERCLRTSTQTIMILLGTAVIWQLNIPFPALLIVLVLLPAFLVAQTHLFLLALQRWQQRENRVDRAVVYGAGPFSRSLASSLLQSPRLGIQLAGMIEERPDQTAGRLELMGYRGRGSITVQSRPVTPALFNALGANLLVLSAANLSQEHAAAAIDAASHAGARVGFLVSPAARLDEHWHHEEVDGVLFSYPTNHHAPWYYPGLKRSADLVLAAILLMLLAPLLLLISLLIRFDSPGPALFVQKRVGRDGELFDMYKFRSMYASTPKYELSPTNSRDIRITRIGRVLRRTSLDELPQLINVLLGNMSLVGPRPEMPFIVDSYDDAQRRRLAVTPGITGLWQLSADRAFPIHHNVEYDLYYIRNRSLFIDFAILIHTLFFALSGGV